MLERRRDVPELDVLEGGELPGDLAEHVVVDVPRLFEKKRAEDGRWEGVDTVVTREGDKEVKG